VSPSITLEFQDAFLPKSSSMSSQASPLAPPSIEGGVVFGAVGVRISGMGDVPRFTSLLERRLAACVSSSSAAQAPSAVLITVTLSSGARWNVLCMGLDGFVAMKPENIALAKRAGGVGLGDRDQIFGRGKFPSPSSLNPLEKLLLLGSWVPGEETVASAFSCVTVVSE